MSLLSISKKSPIDVAPDLFACDGSHRVFLDLYADVCAKLLLSTNRFCQITDGCPAFISKNNPFFHCHAFDEVN